MLRLEMVSGPVPELLRVTACGSLAIPAVPGSVMRVERQDTRNGVWFGGVSRRTGVTHRSRVVAATIGEGAVAR